MLENPVAHLYERARDRERRRALVRTYNVVNDMQMKDQMANSRGCRKVCWREVVSEPEEHHVMLVLRHLLHISRGCLCADPVLKST